jgi:hypothetical protein
MTGTYAKRIAIYLISLYVWNDNNIVKKFSNTDTIALNILLFVPDVHSK